MNNSSIISLTHGDRLSTYRTACCAASPIKRPPQNFWRRVTEGLEVSQLWSQFESEARASYRLYSHDVAAKTPEGLTRRGHHLHVVKEFFWAVFEKLSPARRVLLLAGAHSADRPSRRAFNIPAKEARSTRRIRSSLLGRL